MGPETLLLPNTVAVVRGAPHPAAAQRLFEYLQTADVVGRLVAAGALEGAAAPADLPGTLRPDWDELVRDLDRGTAQLQEVFRR